MVDFLNLSAKPDLNVLCCRASLESQKNGKNSVISPRFRSVQIMSFERARRAESNDTKIKDRSKLWAEIQVPEVQKREGGRKLILEEKIEYLNNNSF